jgi:hypothetical protein
MDSDRQQSGLISLKYLQSWGGDTKVDDQTQRIDRQQGDLTSHLLVFQNKESTIKKDLLWIQS